MLPTRILRRAGAISGVCFYFTSSLETCDFSHSGGPDLRNQTVRRRPRTSAARSGFHATLKGPRKPGRCCVVPRAVNFCAARRRCRDAAKRAIFRTPTVRTSNNQTIRRPARPRASAARSGFDATLEGPRKPVRCCVVPRAAIFCAARRRCRDAAKRAIFRTPAVRTSKIKRAGTVRAKRVKNHIRNDLNQF